MLYSIRWTLVSRGFTRINTRTDPYPGLLRHRPCPYDQNQQPKRTCSFAFVDVGNALTILASTHSACAQMRFCCTNNNFIFMCTNELPFFSGKGVYKLLEIVQYSIKYPLPTLDSKWCTKRRVYYCKHVAHSDWRRIAFSGLCIVLYYIGLLFHK